MRDGAVRAVLIEFGLVASCVRGPSSWRAPAISQIFPPFFPPIQQPRSSCWSISCATDPHFAA